MLVIFIHIFHSEPVKPLSPDDIVPGTTHGLPYVTCFVGMHSGRRECRDTIRFYIPIPSMYGIFTYIWLAFKVNVGKYAIHGSYGIFLFVLGWFGIGCNVALIGKKRKQIGRGQKEI